MSKAMKTDAALRAQMLALVNQPLSRNSSRGKIVQRVLIVTCALTTPVAKMQLSANVSGGLLEVLLCGYKSNFI